MSNVHLEYVNDAYCRVRTDASTLMELSEHFTYYAENYKFHPKYKTRVWDGKIRLINRLTGLVYAGLAKRIKKFCDANDYAFSFDEQLAYDNISEHELKEFIKTLNLPENKEERNYQFDSVLKCIRTKRRTLVSPTSSGKSLMIYIISQWYGLKTLIIVPTTGLVVQFENDLREYGFKGKIVTSVGGLLKDNDICFINITAEDGNVYTFKGSEYIKIINSKIELKQAKDLTIDDEIDDRWLQQYRKKQIL